MGTKRLLIPLGIALILLSSISVIAIKGTIGNSRMVLRLEPGESIEKYVLVRNTNDVPLTITLSPTGDLADNVKLEEETFILNPDEEKRAYFTIEADEQGVTETKINVKFTPAEGSSVGLASTVIIIAQDESQDSQENNNEKDVEENQNFSFGIKGLTSNTINSNNDKSNVSLLLIPTIILVVLLLILFAYSFKLKSKKKVKEVHE